MRFALLFMLLFASSLVAAQSRQPPKTVGQPSGQTKQSTTAGQDAKEDKRGTAGAPLVVSPLIVKTVAQKSDEETAAEKKERREHARTDRWTIGIGVATILILVVQAIVFGWQARRLRQTVEEMQNVRPAMERSANAAEKAAVAAAQSAAVTGDSSERQLRAYVAITECEYRTTDTNWIVVGKFKNVGQTPAFDVRVKGNAFISKYPLKDIPTFDFENEDLSKIALFPTEDATFYEIGEQRPQAPDPSMPPAQNAFNWGTTNALWLVVEVRYLDTFKKEHFTRCCIHSGNVISAVNKWDNFHNHYRGNDAD